MPLREPLAAGAAVGEGKMRDAVDGGTAGLEFCVQGFIAAGANFGISSGGGGGIGVAVNGASASASSIGV